MPFVRSLAFIYYILLAASISLNSKIISPCSYYIKKGLVYITIIALSGYQPSFYSNKYSYIRNLSGYITIILIYHFLVVYYLYIYLVL